MSIESYYSDFQGFKGFIHLSWEYNSINIKYYALKPSTLMYVFSRICLLSYSPVYDNTILTIIYYVLNMES